MEVSPLEGKPADPALLVNVPKLVTAYYTQTPDPSVTEQRISFGTSGHRGSPFEKSFNEWHILAISQAIYLYRKQQNIDGHLFLGMDTYTLSIPPLGGEEKDQEMIRLRKARVTASVRLATPNFERMLLTWDLTVDGLTVSFPAI